MVIAVITLALLISMLTGCMQEEGMSIDERISAFVSDLNKSDRNDLKDHFHYTQVLKNGFDNTYWDLKFSQELGSYSLVSITEVSSNVSSAVIKGGVALTGSTYVFNMKKDGEDWMIYSISGTPNVP